MGLEFRRIARTPAARPDPRGLREAAKVLGVRHRAGRAIATIRLVEDRPLELGVVFVNERTHRAWRVRAVGFGQPEAWAQGIRDVELEPADRYDLLDIGDLLLVEGAP